MRTTTTKNSKAKKTKKDGRSKQTTNLKNRYIFLEQARNITKVIEKDPGVKDNKHYMLKSCSVWGYQFKNCSERLQKDKDIIKAAVANDPEVILSIDQKVISEMNKSNFLCDDNSDSEFESEKLYNTVLAKTTSIDFIFHFIKKFDDKYALLKIMEKYGSVKEIVEKVVTKWYHGFQYASEELRGDKQLAELILRKHGDGLRYVSKELQNDPEIVEIAVVEDPHTLKHASNEIRNNNKTVHFAVKRNPIVLQYALDKPRKDKEIVKTAVLLNPVALQHAHEEIQDDKDFMLSILKHKGQAFKFVSKRLKKDPETVLTAVRNYPHALEDASEEIRANRDIVKTAMDKDRDVLKFASEGLRNELKWYNR